MKKIKITLLLVALLISSVSYAQFANSRSDNSSFNRKGEFGLPKMHLGIRAGVSSNSLGSPYDALVDLHLAVMGDLKIIQNSPIYIESGLQLINRGFKYGDVQNALALDIPILGSYHFSLANNMFLQPFTGPYIGYNFEYEDVEYGLRLGCGFSWKKLYANMGYDFGLNKLENYYDDYKTGTFFISVGWNFIYK